jgi:hypothetical protein
MVWILLAFMILWDHPNLFTLSSSSYKRRRALMEKVSLALDWKFDLRLLAWLRLDLRFYLSR